MLVGVVGVVGVGVDVEPGGLVCFLVASTIADFQKPVRLMADLVYPFVYNRKAIARETFKLSADLAMLALTRAVIAGEGGIGLVLSARHGMRWSRHTVVGQLRGQEEEATRGGGVEEGEQRHAVQAV